MKSELGLWLRVAAVIGAAAFAVSPIVFWPDKPETTTFTVLVGLFGATWALIDLRRWLNVAVYLAQIAIGATSLWLGISWPMPAMTWFGVFALVSGIRGLAGLRKGASNARKSRPEADTLTHSFLDN